MKVQVFSEFYSKVGMHGYPAKYLLSGQIVAFFTICICIRLEKFFTICICICIRPGTFLLSVSVSGQQNANRYRYLKKFKFDIKFSWANPIHHLSAPKCQCPEWLGTSHYFTLLHTTSTKKGQALGSGGSRIVALIYIWK